MSHPQRHVAGPLLLRAAVRLSPWLVIAGVALATPFTVRVVRGASMAPAMVPGDVCLIREGVRAVERGQVLLFRKDGWPGGVLHRVAATRDDGSIETRGDANPVSDLDPVPREDVLGRCVLVLPTGRAAYFLGTHDWW